MFRSLARGRWSRLLLVIVLVTGQLLLPAFAAVCAVDGASAATVADAGDDDGAIDCCDDTGCGDCCLHANAAPVELVRHDPVPFHGSRPERLRASPACGDYPVDIRPPIAT